MCSQTENTNSSTHTKMMPKSSVRVGYGRMLPAYRLCRSQAMQYDASPYIASTTGLFGSGQRAAVAQ